jgi:hypothetical protein
VARKALFAVVGLIVTPLMIGPRGGFSVGVGRRVCRLIGLRATCAAISVAALVARSSVAVVGCLVAFSAAVVREPLKLGMARCSATTASTI